MAATYTLIASNTLSSSAASVTFSAIPNTFTDLVLKINARNTDTSNGYFLVQLNSDSSTNYSNTRLRANGSTVTSLRSLNSSSLQFLWCTTSGDTTNSFGSTELYIPSYLSSANKSLSGFSVSETNNTAANIHFIAYLWRNTAAIDSIYIYNLPTLQFVSGSSFFLYGIKNS